MASSEENDAVKGLLLELADTLISKAETLTKSKKKHGDDPAGK